MKNDEIRQRIDELSMAIRTVGYRLQRLTKAMAKSEKEFLALALEKDGLERQLISVRRVSVRVQPVKPTPFDIALALSETMSASQVEALLAEIQGSEEDGKEIEYRDEPEVYENLDDNFS